jgi:hypothetical protein
MSIAEKLTTVAENVPKVYEAGKQAERDSFWSVFQGKGNGANYRYAFCYGRVNDKTYNPIYDIVCTDSDSAGQYMFYQSPITDTKVGIYAPETNLAYAFRDSKIKIIRLLNVHETTEFTGTFSGCSALKEIRFSGTIGQNISFYASPLTVDSMNSIIEHLKDYSGTGTTHTLTFKADRKTMLTEEEKAIATNKGWTLVWN